MFERRGDDLYTDLIVDLYSALLGGKTKVETLRGKIQLDIKPDVVSNHVGKIIAMRLGHEAIIGIARSPCKHDLSLCHGTQSSWP